MPGGGHPRVEHVEALLALAAADDLADPRRQHVHRRDGPAVVVDAHVERLDLLRVVHQHHRAGGVLLADVALVLRLQVDPPLDRKLELLLRALQHADRLGVVHPHELRIDDPLQLGDHALLDALLEERHVVGALGEHRAEDVLEQRLGQRRVVRQVGERDLRLDHPELGEMPAGVGVLRAERRAEGVDLRQREAVALDVQLPRDGEERLAAEEVLREVGLPGGDRAAGWPDPASRRGRARPPLRRRTR